MIVLRPAREPDRRGARRGAPDPPRPAPGPLSGNRCVVCRKKRQAPKGNYATRDEWERDAFCSSKCARFYFGTSLDTDEEPESEEP